MRWPFLVLMLLGLPAFVPTPGLAHAVLLESAPADGARLGALPSAIELRFNEPVVPIALRLFAGDGQELADAGSVQARGERVLLTPVRPLPAGIYLLSYRVASADAHPVAGAVRFAIGGGTGEVAAPPPGEPADGWRRAGTALEIALHDPSGQPLAGREVDLLIGQPAAGIERRRFPLVESSAPGVYATADAGFLRAGPWTVRVEVLVDDFTRIAFAAEVPIGAAGR